MKFNELSDFFAAEKAVPKKWHMDFKQISKILSVNHGFVF
jgi:hypothetical protein